MLAKLAASLDAPADSKLRRVEHLLALYVAYRVVAGAVRLGPSGLKKAVVGKILAAVRSVPALQAKVEEEEAVSPLHCA